MPVTRSARAEFNVPTVCTCKTSMSDSPDAPDASVLGKRVRNEAGQNENDLQVSNINSTVEDDSDDDDVGPMPMPAQAPAAKKKRRGLSTFSIWKINFLLIIGCKCYHMNVFTLSIFPTRINTINHSCIATL